MNRLRYELVIFDLDGTLIDSKQDIMDSVNGTLRTLSLPERPDSELLQYVGSGIEPLLAKAISGSNGCSIAKTLEIFKTCYLRSLLLKTRPYPGVMEGLQSLSSIHLCIITNKSILFSDKIVKGLKMDRFFKFVYGGDSFPLKKPDPVAVTRILDDTMLKKTETLMVGDSPVDIEAGKRAGVDTCGVSYGYKDKKYLIEAGADYLKDSFSEVVNLIQKGE